jgi:hypothetical protein
MIIGIFVMAMTTAIIVENLSNNSEVDADVQSPLTVTSNLNAESYYGGEVIFYKSSVVNNINRNLDGILTLSIVNDKGTASCDDFEYFTLVSETPELVPTAVTCVNEGMGIVKITKLVSYNAFGSDTYLGEFGLKVGIEPAPYEFNTQIMSVA